MDNIKLVIFDIDGTLVDDYSAIERSVNYVMKKYKLAVANNRPTKFSQILIPHTNPLVSTRGWRGWLFKWGGSLGLQAEGAPLGRIQSL